MKKRKEAAETSPSAPVRMRGRPRAFYDKSETNYIRSLDRALTVLKIVSESDGLALTEIAEIAEEAPATTYRALITMQAHGLVEFNESGQLWQIGAEAFRIGNAFLRRTNLIERCRPIMQRLMVDTGETANLAVIDGVEVIFISQVETHQPIRAFFRPGTRGAIHSSGIGKALLAHMDEDELLALLRRIKLTSFTENTLTDTQSLMDDMALIRERGFSIDNEERTEGMRCIAAPVFNAHGEAIAGISLSGPSIRVAPDRDDEFARLVVEAANAVTEAIGGTVPSEDNEY